jgi:UrcA family protein
MRSLNVAIAAACLLTAAVAGQSQAADTNATRETSAERLAVGSVDFRDAAQVRAFHQRLQQAALFVCGVNGEAGREQRQADRACAEKAVRDAVNSLDRPLLTATYQQAGAPMVARGY